MKCKDFAVISVFSYAEAENSAAIRPILLKFLILMEILDEVQGFCGDKRIFIR